MALVWDLGKHSASRGAYFARNVSHSFDKAVARPKKVVWSLVVKHVKKHAKLVGEHVWA